MPRLAPLSPIFDPKAKYGKAELILETQTGLTRVRPPTLTVPVSAEAPAHITPWTGTIVSLGYASVSGGASQSTIDITGLTIPQNALVLVMSSCGLNAANTTTATCTNITLDTSSTHDNTTPNPDRLTRIFRGIAGASAGSTITVTFPGSTGERMACACYITGAPTTNNGADAIAGAAHNNNNPFDITQAAGTGQAQVGFAWISASGSTDPITGTNATQVLDYSDGNNYTLAIVKWPNGQTDPVMSIPTLGGGQGISVQLTGLLN